MGRFNELLFGRFTGCPQVPYAPMMWLRLNLFFSFLLFKSKPGLTRLYIIIMIINNINSYNLKNIKRSLVNNNSASANVRSLNGHWLLCTALVCWNRFTIVMKLKYYIFILYMDTIILYTLVRKKYKNSIFNVILYHTRVFSPFSKLHLVIITNCVRKKYQFITGISELFLFLYDRQLLSQ